MLFFSRIGISRLRSVWHYLPIGLIFVLVNSNWIYFARAEPKSPEPSEVKISAQFSGAIEAGRNLPVELILKISEPCSNLLTEVQAMDATTVVGGEPFLHYQCQNESAALMRHAFLLLPSKSKSPRLRVYLSYISQNHVVNLARTLVVSPEHPGFFQIEAERALPDRVASTAAATTGNSNTP